MKRGVHLPDGDLLPTPPEFDPEDFDRCIERGSLMPIVFEWYKWTGLAAQGLASIRPDSPGFLDMPRVHAAVLRGLLNRCSRLVLSVLRLASFTRHGESTKLIGRSVVETAVTISWLCVRNSAEDFSRYLAHGLKPELRMKDEIERNIAERNGIVWPIEARMLGNIELMIERAGLTEAAVRNAKPLPDLASRYRALELPDTSYNVEQRLGSHAVHGTWPDLLFHYLEFEDNEFVLRDGNVLPEDMELASGALQVLEALSRFASTVLYDERSSPNVTLAVDSVRDEVVRLTRLRDGDDFHPREEEMD